MDFVIQLFTVDSIPHAVLVFGLVIALGLTLGSLSLWNIRLGVAGVLFAGLFFGHFKLTINPVIMEFMREFGLILFVYTIGMQVGPGFFDSLRKDGLGLNILAAVIVLGGVVLTLLWAKFGHVPLPAAVGLFSGATTNTPSLAAAQQALKEIPTTSAEALKQPGLGYAVAYPFGIVGIILTMILVRFFFRIHPVQEAELYARQDGSARTGLESADIRVENSNLNGISIQQIPALEENGVVISRIFHEGAMKVALPESRIYPGDIVRAVGPSEKLNRIMLVIGSRASIDLRGITGNVLTKRVIVTRNEVAGKTVAELQAAEHGVAVTRINRGGIEIPAQAEVAIRFADILTVVGGEEALQKFAAELGNAPKHLDHPQLVPIFTGIALGVVIGSIPFYFPGMPAPVKLGLAGGPLLVAILLSRIGKIGKLVWYMPMSANFMLREVGIALFLACVGLRSGDEFVKTLTSGSGFYWMAAGATITFLPIFLAGIYARLFMKKNYLSVCGLLAGSMTDPPALAFANQITPSSAQSVAYAAVYPLVMILRVLAAQVMVLALSGGK